MAKYRKMEPKKAVGVVSENVYSIKILNKDQIVKVKLREKPFNWIF